MSEGVIMSRTEKDKRGRERQSAAESDHKNIDPGGWLLTHQACSLESGITPGANRLHDMLHPTQKPLPCLSASVYSVHTTLSVINLIWTVNPAPAQPWFRPGFAGGLHRYNCLWMCNCRVCLCQTWVCQALTWMTALTGSDNLWFFKLMRCGVPIVWVQWLVLVVRYTTKKHCMLC